MPGKYTYRKGMSTMRRTVLRRKLAQGLRRSKYTPRVPRNKLTVSRNVHSFRRGCNSDYATVTGTGLSGAMTFQLSDTLGYAEFDNLYDRYMLTYVIIKVRLVSNPNSTSLLNSSWTGIPGANGPQANWYPRFFYCKDYDDSSAETLAALKERGRTKMAILKPNTFHKIVIKPAVLFQTYYTSTGSAYSPHWRQWIDMAQPSMPHYGLKYNIDCDGLNLANDSFKVELEKVYYFKCKDVR